MAWASSSSKPAIVSFLANILTSAGGGGEWKPEIVAPGGFGGHLRKGRKPHTGACPGLCSCPGILLPSGEGGGSRMRVRAERSTSLLRSARPPPPPPPTPPGGA